MSSYQDVQGLAKTLAALQRKKKQGALSPEDAAQHRSLQDELLGRLSDGGPNERRQFLRIPTDLEARLRINDAAITWRATELSLGGLSLRGNIWIPVDQEVAVENLRTGRRDYPTAIRAKVIWKNEDRTDGPAAGLQFLDLGPQEKAQLRSVFGELFAAFVERLAQGDLPADD